MGATFLKLAELDAWNRSCHSLNSSMENVLLKYISATHIFPQHLFFWQPSAKRRSSGNIWLSIYGWRKRNVRGRELQFASVIAHRLAKTTTAGRGSKDNGRYKIGMEDITCVQKTKGGQYKHGKTYRKGWQKHDAPLYTVAAADNTRGC